MPPSLQKRLGPRNGFFPRKLQLLLKKLLNNKIFNSSFAIKKVTLILAQDASFPEKFVKCTSKTVFHRFFFPENTAFFEKLVEYKDIQHLICDKNGYIHFWCKMTPDRSTFSKNTIFSIIKPINFFFFGWEARPFLRDRGIGRQKRI